MRKERGFTLLEVMIALAILGFAISAIVSFHERGTIMTARARDMTVATALARTKMEEVKIEIEKKSTEGSLPDPGISDGRFDAPNDRFRWSSEIKKVEIPVPSVSGDDVEGGSSASGPVSGSATASMLQSVLKTISKQISDSVREVTLTISWDDLGKERSMSVTTHVVK